MTKGSCARGCAAAIIALSMLPHAYPCGAGEDAKFQRDLARLKNCATLETIRAQTGTRALTAYEKRLKAELVPWYLAHCMARNPS